MLRKPRVEKSSCKRSLHALFLISLSLPSVVLAAPAQSRAGELHYTRGAELARAGSLNQALDELRKAAELAPGKVKIHNLLGIVLTQLGRLKEANQAYSRALALAPDFFPARKNRAVNAFTQGDLKFAAAEFDVLARLVPRDFVPHLFLGLLAIEGSHFENARLHLLKANTLSPNDGKVLLALTRACFSVGDRQAALELARKMRAGRPGSGGDQFELGVVLAQFGADADAAEVFREMRLKNPGSYDVGFNLALLQYRSGQLEAALLTVEELLSFDKTGGAGPQAGPPLPSLKKSAQDTIKHSRSGKGGIKEGSSRQKGSPGEGSVKAHIGELMNLRGWVYVKMRRLDKARESLERAIELEPGQADHYLDLSTVLYNQGNHEGALQVISERLQKNVDKDRLQVRMGLLCEKSGNDKDAERWYRTAIQVNAANRAAYLALARLLTTASRPQEVLKLLAQAIQQLPQEASLHCRYGEQLLESSDRDPNSGKLDEVAAALKKALQLNPFYANAHYLLGKLYLRQGNDQSAESHFEKACGFDPSLVSAYHQLSVIARRQGKREKAAELAKVVQELNEREDKSYQEDFLSLMGERLRGAAIHKSSD